MWLRVFERVDEREVVCDLFGGRRLEENVGVVASLKGGEGISRVRERSFWDDGRCERGRRVEVLEERPAERYDGGGGVDGNSSEQREVFAAMSECTKMSGRCVREQNHRKRGNLPIQ